MKKESNRTIYKKAWYATSFLSDNDHMDVFDGKIIWLLGVITVSSILLFVGMVLWNMFEPERRIDGLYVLIAAASLAFLFFVVYLIFINTHNKEVAESKATLVETRTLYPKIWKVIQGHSEYSLIPEVINQMDKAAKEDDEKDDEKSEIEWPEPDDDVEEENFFLPENATGLDYDELMEDPEIARYLEEEDEEATTEEEQKPEEKKYISASELREQLRQIRRM